MFIDSVSYAKRAEELLWRKVFYEPLYLYKLYVKNNDRPDCIADFELSLRMHILSGIGYYQSLLLQVQSESLMTLEPSVYSWLTTPFHVALYNGTVCRLHLYCLFAEYIYHFDLRNNLSHVDSPCRVAQRCLMYIGDLFRYLVELGELGAKTLAFGYYTAAFHVDPALGLPQNQLGILDIGRCYGLNALYHYLLCLGARVPFEGARRNLLTVLTKNEVRYRKLFGEKPIYGLYLRHPNRYR
ncbi:unnamed protein product [Echinostoma caproni]|uniref:P0 n=1 Tax=Echinostoma caproni TaxID=27848 RepID=A0A183BGD4_9TREM|nr:unnamed protein product [Echinostoma caproni]